MLDQEAAFAQIQEAKTMVEEDLQRRLEEFEEERERLQKMASSAAALEQQLEQARPRVASRMPRPHTHMPRTPMLASLCADLSIRCHIIRSGCSCRSSMCLLLGCFSASELCMQKTACTCPSALLKT